MENNDELLFTGVHTDEILDKLSWADIWIIQKLADEQAAELSSSGKKHQPPIVRRICGLLEISRQMDMAMNRRLIQWADRIPLSPDTEEMLQAELAKQKQK